MITHLIRVACIICITSLSVIFHADATDKSTPGLKFIRIDKSLHISLKENPAIFYSEHHDLIPANELFEPNENVTTTWYPLTNSSQNWIRVVLSNPTDSILTVNVKYIMFPSEVHVLYKGSNESWQRKKAGKLVVKDPDVNSFYCANRIEIRPGTDTIYFYNADSWNKFRLDYIKFELPQQSNNDKAAFYSGTDYLSFYLFAFVMLLIFQIIYIIIQSLYHRKIEYREYLFYLISILIYFTIRYEIYFSSDILTGNYPHLRRLLNDLMLILPFAFYLRFGRYFIEMPDKYPDMNRKIRIVERLVFVLSGVFVLMWFTDLRKYDSMFVQVTIFACSIYSLRLIYFFFRQRNKQIGFILAGSLAAIIGHILGTAFSYASSSGLIVSMQPILFTMTGLMFEIFFFNTGLGYKAKTEQQEKVKAQEKLINQLKSNRKMQDRLQNMRNRIASDLHDDVGSTLSSIGLYSEVGIDQIDKNPAHVKGILQKISSSSQRMMIAMNDIVWAIHSRSDKGEDLFERIKLFAEERLGSLDIQFSLQTDSKVNTLIFTLEARRNILLLLKEAINNAAKYSQSARIDCSFVISGEFLEIEVKDYGIGFENGVKKFGNGLTTMRNRALDLNGKFEIISSEGQGTTIRLSIPLSDVILENHSNGQ